MDVKPYTDKLKEVENINIPGFSEDELSKYVTKVLEEMGIFGAA